MKTDRKRMHDALDLLMDQGIIPSLVSMVAQGMQKLGCIDVSENGGDTSCKIVFSDNVRHITESLCLVKVYDAERDKA